MDITAIVALLGSSVGIAVVFFVARRMGRISILKEQATKQAEVSHEQTKIAVNKPSAADSLHSGKF